MGTTELSAAFNGQGVAVLLHQRVSGAADLIDQVVDIDVFGKGLHPAGFDLGKIENIVDERQQVGTGLVDLFQVRNKVLLLQVLGFLLQHLAVAEDGIHRSTQLVTHVGEKCALGLVRGIGGLVRGIGGLFCHLEFIKQSLLFHLDCLPYVDLFAHSLVVGVTQPFRTFGQIAATEPQRKRCQRMENV